jgi:hypothetical protein
MRSGTSNAGKAERLLLAVLHEEEPGHPEVDLLAGGHVRVRVIPIGPRAILDGVAEGLRRARRDRILGVPIHISRREHAVPVDVGRLGELVDELRRERVAFADANRGGRRLAAKGPGLRADAAVYGGKDRGDQHAACEVVGQDKRLPLPALVTSMRARREPRELRCA